jgi:hypothetical protein
VDLEDLAVLEEHQLDLTSPVDLEPLEDLEVPVVQAELEALAEQADLHLEDLAMSLTNLAMMIATSHHHLSHVCTQSLEKPSRPDPLLLLAACMLSARTIASLSLSPSA